MCVIKSFGFKTDQTRGYWTLHFNCQTATNLKKNNWAKTIGFRTATGYIIGIGHYLKCSHQGSFNREESGVKITNETIRKLLMGAIQFSTNGTFECVIVWLLRCLVQTKWAISCFLITFLCWLTDQKDNSIVGLLLNSTLHLRFGFFMISELPAYSWAIYPIHRNGKSCV